MKKGRMFLLVHDISFSARNNTAYILYSSAGRAARILFQCAGTLSVKYSNTPQINIINPIIKNLAAGARFSI
jgi:hypothetical protein